MKRAGAALAGLAALTLAACLGTAPAPRAETAQRPVASAPAADVIAGRRLAERYCSGCHGLEAAQGPLAEAPPFEALRRRYAPGCLDRLLAEGMLAPLSPSEEGSPRRHPRMPQAVLGDDEVAELRAYLLSLDPRPIPPAPVCGPARRAALRGINTAGG